MKEGSNVILTARLYKGATEITDNLTYAWYDINNNQIPETSKELKINNIDFNDIGFKKYRCEIVYNGGG